MYLLRDTLPQLYLPVLSNHFTLYNSIPIQRTTRPYKLLLRDAGSPLNTQYEMKVYVTSLLTLYLLLDSYLHTFPVKGVSLPLS